MEGVVAVAGDYLCRGIDIAIDILTLAKGNAFSLLFHWES